MIKGIAYLAIAVVVSYVSNFLDSSFICDFSTNLISLLTTIFAINMASSAIIASKIAELNSLGSGSNFSSSQGELKKSVAFQLSLIAIAFVVGVFRKSQLISNLVSIEKLSLACNTVTVFVMIYFIEIMYDIGDALFKLMNFKKP